MQGLHEFRSAQMKGVYGDRDLNPEHIEPVVEGRVNLPGCGSKSEWHAGTESWGAGVAIPSFRRAILAMPQRRHDLNKTNSNV